MKNGRHITDLSRRELTEYGIFEFNYGDLNEEDELYLWERGGWDIANFPKDGTDTEKEEFLKSIDTPWRYEFIVEEIV